MNTKLFLLFLFFLKINLGISQTDIYYNYFNDNNVLNYLSLETGRNDSLENKVRYFIKKNSIKTCEIFECNSKDTLNTKLYIYNSDGQILFIKETNKTGNIDQQIYKYNEKGILQNIIFIDNKIDTTLLYLKYDETGLLIGNVILTNKNDTVSQLFYYYNNNKIIKTIYNEKNTICIWDFKYSDSTVISYRDNKYMSKYSFDLRGKILLIKDINCKKTFYYLNDDSFIELWKCEDEETQIMSYSFYKNNFLNDYCYVKSGKQFDDLIHRVSIENNNKGLILKITTEDINSGLYDKFFKKYSYSFY